MKRSEIEFRTGSILRKEMLQDLYEYPRNAFESMFSDYSEGILYGLDWKEINQQQHIISPGALKFKNKLYFLKDELYVEKELENQLRVNGAYRLCFMLQDVIQQIDSKKDYYLKLEVLQDEEYQKKKDNVFWYAYIKFSGERKIELIKLTKFGVPGLIAASDGFEYQLPNWLIRENILPELEQKMDKHPLDYVLLRDIYEGKSVSISFINIYLNELKKESLGYDCNPVNALNNLLYAVRELKMKVTINSVESRERETDNKPKHQGGLL